MSKLIYASIVHENSLSVRGGARHYAAPSPVGVALARSAPCRRPCKVAIVVRMKRMKSRYIDEGIVMEMSVGSSAPQKENNDRVHLQKYRDSHIPKMSGVSKITTDAVPATSTDGRHVVNAACSWRCA
ncbi:hypothetical protein EVAR_16312_1 [Eumeta japonica]|uniref:Uncharacterized protein n=1 Tax=Eumeta variegata TaxID=151549 RepID=A0A4C1VGH1_EUMVA|nr:hypothetical protein EVAR_16312_1 [Eumeta japonica]